MTGLGHLRPLGARLRAGLACALVAWSAGCAEGWPLPLAAPRADPARCTVQVAPSTSVSADGLAHAQVTVTVVDARDRPLPGYAVQVVVSGGEVRVEQPERVTDARGVLTARVASTRPETKTVLAVLDPGGASIPARQAPSLVFVADAPAARGP